MRIQSRSWVYMAKATPLRGKELTNLLCAVSVDTVDTLDLGAVLEDDDGWDGGDLQTILGSGVLGDVDLVVVGGGRVLLRSPVSSLELFHYMYLVILYLLLGLGVNLALVGVDEDVLAGLGKGRIVIRLAGQLGVAHDDICCRYE